MNITLVRSQNLFEDHVGNDLCPFKVTFDLETKNRAKVFEIYKSPEAVDAHMAGVAFGKFQKWCTENDALAEPLGLEKHYLLEDAEKGIVA